MKKLFILLFLFPLVLSAQESKIRYYSYSEFFKMVENKPDSVFELKNAIIKFDKKVDQAHTFTGSTESSIKYSREDSITITKEIRLENVNFISDRTFEEGSFQFIGLYKIQFLKPLTIINSSFGVVDRCTFKERVRVTFDENFSDFEREVQVLEKGFSGTDINNSLFLKGVFYFAMEADLGNMQWGLLSCEVVCSSINNSFGSIFNTQNQLNFWITNTKFKGSGEEVFVRVSSTQTFDFDKNSFENSTLKIRLAEQGKINDLNFSENRFDSRVKISLGQMNEDNTIDWSQFSSGLLNDDTFMSWFAYLSLELDTLDNFNLDPEPNSPINLEYYLNTARIENSKVYRGEMKLLGKLYALYQQQHDTEYANGAYMEMKDLETSRLAYLYRVNPSFDTFFTWKRINLKVEEYILKC